MKKILNKNSILENQNHLRFLIDEFLSELKADSYKNQKKILELCHVGKFLMFFDYNLTIESINEEPDFIIKEKKVRKGLEHQIIVSQESKETEGYFNNLIMNAEKELRKDKDLPNFLANIYVNPYFHGKKQDKKKLIDEICILVKHYILEKELKENDIIDRISSMNHSQISLNSNLGAWWQKEITKEIIHSAILKKEKKIDNYISKTGLNQWLLLVIGGVGESSYQCNENLDIELETKFERVFLLEDFNNNLYQLK